MKSNKPRARDVYELKLAPDLCEDTLDGKASPEQTSTFPEGGLQGWCTLAGATLVQYCTFGYTNAFGVYEDFYVREGYLSHYTPSDIGWIGGAQIFLIFSSGVITGRAFDRGYFRHLMITGSLLHALALFMLSITRENKFYQVLLSQGICLGLSTGLCCIPSLTIVSHYFQRHRPFAMGVVAAGTATGAVLHPIMLNNLFHGPLGFHNGIRVSAALNSFLLILANILMRTRLPPKRVGAAIPIAQFAHDTPYVMVVIAGMLAFCGFFYPVFYLQLDATTHRIDRTSAFYSLSTLNAASIVGRIVPPIWAPKHGILNLLIFFTFATGIMTLWMIFVKDVAGITVFAILYGFFSGASVGLTPPMLGSLANDVNEIGARIGIDFAFCGIIGLFSSPIAGALLTSHYYWSRPSLFAGITMISAGFFFLVARMLVAKRRGTGVV